MHKFISAISVTIIMITGLTTAGCNTMRGFGKDVERGGERVQDAAKPKQGTSQPGQ